MKFKSLFQFFVSFAFAISLVSCGPSKDKVVIDYASDDTGHFVIDDTMRMHFTGDTTFAIQLTRGQHFIQKDKGSKKEFNVMYGGGLLNLSEQVYVKYDIVYAETETSAKVNFPKGITGPNLSSTVILVDSQVIGTKYGDSMISDSALAKMIPKLLAKKNHTYSSLEEKMGSEYFHGLSQTIKEDLFIPKSWDYDMIDSIPETIEIQTSKYSMGTQTETKKGLVRQNIFALMAMFAPEEYFIKSLKEIREGKTDKVEQKKKNEKQMKFE
jgi:hypothetical protein